MSLKLYKVVPVDDFNCGSLDESFITSFVSQPDPAREFLKQLTEKGISWNKTGQVFNKRALIPGSNIVKLLISKFGIYKTNKALPGEELFQQEELFHNWKTWESLQ